MPDCTDSFVFTTPIKSAFEAILNLTCEEDVLGGTTGPKGKSAAGSLPRELPTD